MPKVEKGAPVPVAEPAHTAQWFAICVLLLCILASLVRTIHQNAVETAQARTPPPAVAPPPSQAASPEPAPVKPSPAGEPVAAPQPAPAPAIVEPAAPPAQPVTQPTPAPEPEPKPAPEERPNRRRQTRPALVPGVNAIVSAKSGLASMGPDNAEFLSDADGFVSREPEVLHKWIVAGRLHPVANGTPVGVLLLDSGLALVRVQSGKRAGQTGWIRVDELKAIALPETD
jgi:hypothetical protein